jgi:hypothetical protein
VSNFKAPSRHSPRAAEEDDENPEDSPSPGRYLNPGSIENETGVLTIRYKHESKPIHPRSKSSKWPVSKNAQSIFECSFLHDCYSTMLFPQSKQH